MSRALVTGASGSLGQAIAQRLARDGAHVIAHANRNTSAAESVVEAIRGAGGSAQAVAFDVTDGTATRQALEGLLADGPIQIVVNNAGIHDDGLLAAMSEEQWQRVVAVSLHGFFNVTQPLLMPMLKSRWGRIINISSIAGVIGNAGQVNYAAAKAALHGATKALAREVGARGVTVNAVAPGIIATEATEQVFSPEQIAALVPMRRAGTPAEVAALVGFLASPEASYVSAQIISVSGGMV